MVPAIHVYTRHGKHCRHKEDRFWKRCACPKWAQWSFKGKQHRKPLRTREWDAAVALARKIEAEYESAALGKPPAKSEDTTIDYAVSLFLLDKETQGLAPATISKLTTIFEKQFLKFFNECGIFLLREVTTPRLVEWRVTWEDGPLAAKKRQERIRGFFHFCVRNHWITENPALGLSRIKATHRPAVPFTKGEYERILMAVDNFGKQERHRQRIRTLILLLRWSGLAIRDAVTLERGRLDAKGRLFLSRAKTGTPVLCPLPPSVAEALRDLPNSNPRFFFWTGRGNPKSVVADAQRSLRRVFDLANLKHSDGKRKRAHPHMLRHTFATECLAAGVPVEDVAKVLGHSSVRTTEKFYSHWIVSRADRLEQSLKAAWGDSTA